VIIIDQLIFDQFSLNWSIDFWSIISNVNETETKTSPPLYHQKNNYNTEYHPQKMRNQEKKHKAKDQNEKKSTQIIHTFHLSCMINVGFFVETYIHMKQNY